MAQMLSALAIFVVLVGNYAFASQAVLPISPREAKPSIGDTEQNSTESDTFKVTLELDSDTNPPQIEWSKPFRVALRNESPHTIRIWNPNSEQGYQQYTIEFSNERTGVKHIVKRVEIEPEYWKSLGHSNGSNTDASELNRDVLHIQANGIYEFEITLSQIAWGERAWSGLPIPNTDDRYQVTLRFESNSSADSNQSDVWSGKIESVPVETLYVANELKTPHLLIWNGMADAAIDMMTKEPTWINRVDDTGCTPLHHAAHFGPQATVQWLLDHDADVNAKTKSGSTPLHFTSDPEIVRLILAKKPDLANHNRRNGETAFQAASKKLAYTKDDAERLLYRKIVDQYLQAGAVFDPKTAIYLGELDQLKAILKKSPQLADDFQKGSLLRIAAKLDRMEICEYLIKEFHVDVNDFERGSGYPIIMESLANPKVVKLLIDHGADLQTRITWKGGRSGIWIVGDRATSLHYAAQDGVPETINLLIDGGVDPMAEAEDASEPNERQNALEVAATFGRVENVEAILLHPEFKSQPIEARQPVLDKSLLAGTDRRWKRDDTQRPRLIKALLDAGANPNFSRDDVTALQITSCQIQPNHPDNENENAELREIVKILLENGAILDLFSASALGEIESVRLLLAADSTKANSLYADGLPAIHIAIRMDHREIVAALLAVDGSIDVKNSDEVTGVWGTPLHVAALWGRTDIARLFLEKKADINSEDSEQATPLHLAVLAGNISTVKMLIEKGAELDVVDKEGKTPLDSCDSSEQSGSEIREIIQEAIAKRKK